MHHIHQSRASYVIITVIESNGHASQKATDVGVENLQDALKFSCVWIMILHKILSVASYQCFSCKKLILLYQKQQYLL